MRAVQAHAHTKTSRHQDIHHCLEMMYACERVLCHPRLSLQQSRQRNFLFHCPVLPIFAVCARSTKSWRGPASVFFPPLCHRCFCTHSSIVGTHTRKVKNQRGMSSVRADGHKQTFPVNHAKAKHDVSNFGANSLAAGNILSRLDKGT